MRVLITGAAGFIGSYLAERLALDGHAVTGVDCFSAFYPPSWKRENARRLKRLGVPVLELDLSTDDTTRLPGVDVVFHLAGEPGLTNGQGLDPYVRHNIAATDRLLRFLIRSGSGLGGIVFTSTSSVYGATARGNELALPRPDSDYGITKLCAEHLVLSRARRAGLPAAVARLFSVYGPRERPDKLFPQAIAAALDGREVCVSRGSLSHSRSFTFVEDVVEGLVRLGERMSCCDGAIVNLGSPAEITVRDALGVLERQVGRRLRVVESCPSRDGDQRHTRADITAARALLDYSPATALEDGLARELEWFRSEIRGSRLWVDVSAQRSTGSHAEPVDLSVVIPVYNEVESIAGVIEETRATLRARDVAFEIVCVDDGSSDGTWSAMVDLQGAGVRVVGHERRRGQSAAVCTGIQASRGMWVATLDGDGQNDPADILALYELASREHVAGRRVLVAGVRQNRRDNAIRRFSSRLANAVRRFVLRDGVADTGCGLKVFRRGDFLDLPYFDHMHRFLPALFRRTGCIVETIPVHHRPRLAGTSKYGVCNRLGVGLVDLCGVWWLTRRMRPVVLTSDVSVSAVNLRANSGERPWPAWRDPSGGTQRWAIGQEKGCASRRGSKRESISS